MALCTCAVKIRAASLLCSLCGGYIDNKETGAQPMAGTNKALTMKQEAQERLMRAMQAAFAEDVTDEMRQTMSEQMARVEKLFLYVPYSWQRGK